MGRLLLFAGANIKKKKGAMTVIAVLIMVATILLYTSITTLTNLTDNLNKSYEQNNLADVEYIIPDSFGDRVEPIIKDADGISEFEKTEGVLFTHAGRKENPDDETKEMGFLAENIDDSIIISKLSSEDNLEDFPDNGIVLGYYLKAALGYKVGDTYHMVVGDNTYDFEIVGFAEDAIFALPLNLPVQKFFMKSEMIDKLEKEGGASEATRIYEYKLKLDNGVSGEELEHDTVMKIYDTCPELLNEGVLSVAWDNMKMGIIIIPAIAMSIILLFAFILIVIIVLVIYYNIKNFMDENIENIGIMKALGYTSKDLLISLFLEMLTVTLAGIIVGLAIGFVASPALGTLEAAMMGVKWRNGIDLIAAGAAAAGVFVLAAVIVLLLGRKYRKIMVLEALRGGVTNYSFKKNHFPLETSRISLTGSLGLKSVFYEKAKSICLVIIVAVLTFAACAGTYVYQVFGKSTENLIQVSGSEVSDIILSTADIRYKEFDIASVEGVESVMYGNNRDISVKHNDTEAELNLDFYDKPENLKYEMMVEGRLPENDEEIVVTGPIAKQLDVSVGDIIQISVQDKYYDFMLVGIDQKINHLGRKGLVTFEGMERVNPGVKPYMAYITLKDGYEFEDVKPLIQEEFPDGSVIEGMVYAENQVSGISNVMFYICLLFLTLALLIVFLILYMVGKNRIISERKLLGVMKALGFTTGQLTARNIKAMAPLTCVSAFIGMGLSMILINPLIAFCFSVFDMNVCEFPVDPVTCLIVVAAIVADSVLVTLLSSLRIRKIEAVKMIKGE